MKKFFFILVALFTFAFSSSVSAADDDWTYAGRFGLLWTPPVAHNVDMYLINHLLHFLWGEIFSVIITEKEGVWANGNKVKIRPRLHWRKLYNEKQKINS